MRVIIVEDEKVFGNNLKQLLEHRGLAVDLLSDSEKAFSRMLLYRMDYDLAIVDLGMPRMSGAELTQKIRAKDVSMPIIILTGNDDTENKVTLLNSGADDYIVKPFAINELMARINSLLRRPAIQKPIIFSAGNLHIDTSTHKVTVAGKEIALTLKEYALLECFVRRAGEVLTREELASKVWDFSTVTLSNVLDVHMKNLRKKLQETHEHAHFETLRGVGYRLVI